QDKKDWQSWLRVSQIYRQKRDFTRAAEAGQKALEIEPNNLEVRYNNVALLEAQGRSADALAAMNNLVQSTAKRTYSAGERSNRIVLLERLAGMYRAGDQWDKAVETYRQIAELEPNAA